MVGGLDDEVHRAGCAGGGHDDREPVLAERDGRNRITVHEDVGDCTEVAIGDAHRGAADKGAGIRGDRHIVVVHPVVEGAACALCPVQEGLHRKRGVIAGRRSGDHHLLSQKGRFRAGHQDRRRARDRADGRDTVERGRVGCMTEQHAAGKSHRAVERERSILRQRARNGRGRVHRAPASQHSVRTHDHPAHVQYPFHIPAPPFQLHHRC